MLDTITDSLGFDFKKLDNSPEFKRLIASLHSNIKLALKDPDSSIGLALNALFVQLSERSSIVMEEANFSTIERGIISMGANKLWSQLK